MSIVIGKPFAWLNTAMLNGLNSMQGSSLILLGIVQGIMLASDLGGPINKAAYAFALAAMAAGNNAPMAANFVASMTPPLAIGIALLDAPEMRASSGGKMVKRFHHVGDEIWNMEI